MPNVGKYIPYMDPMGNVSYMSGGAGVLSSTVSQAFGRKLRTLTMFFQLDPKLQSIAVSWFPIKGGLGDI